MGDAQLPNIGTVSTTKIDGLDIRCARGGTSTGVPVLLTAPWPESIYAFHRLLPVLGAKHPYIAVDLPGYGLRELDRRRSSTVWRRPPLACFARQSV